MTNVLKDLAFPMHIMLLLNQYGHPRAKWENVGFPYVYVAHGNN